MRRRQRRTRRIRTFRARWGRQSVPHGSNTGSRPRILHYRSKGRERWRYKPEVFVSEGRARERSAYYVWWMDWAGFGYALYFCRWGRRRRRTWSRTGQSIRTGRQCWAGCPELLLWRRGGFEVRNVRRSRCTRRVDTRADPNNAFGRAALIANGSFPPTPDISSDPHCHARNANVAV